jgi:hypothetical protein
VQDDIRSLDTITTFADAVDNMIAINLLQEELQMMGQPYSDADLIIQHSNKMPNTENFRALKMEFIDCDVSQFSTSRPSLTHTQPNPQHLRVRKTWDEYCHRIQRFNASDPLNQPKSALSAKMDTVSPKALAVSAESMEAMIRRLLAEASTKPTDSMRTFTQAERDAYKRGRQDTKMERPAPQDRQGYPPRKDQQQAYRPPIAPHLPTRQGQAQFRKQLPPRQDATTFQRFGTPAQSRQRTQDRKAFGAAEQRHDDEEEQGPSDERDRRVFSATEQSENDGFDEEDGDDRYAMMGRRDYQFDGSEDEDEGPA